MRGRPRSPNVDVSEFTFNLINDTDKAILVELEDGGEQWIPRSALLDYVDNEDGTCWFEINDQDAMSFNLA